MNTRIIICALILTLAMLVSALKERCPPEEDMVEGCTCDGLRKTVHCRDIMNPQHLHSVMHTISKYSIYTFKLTDSILMYLPSGMFRNVPIETLDIRNSEILGWESEEGSVMFEGVEDSLKTIIMYNIVGLRSWRWSVFSTLKRLEYLGIRRADVGQIDKDFALVSSGNLQELHLDYANIQSIHPEAFAKLTELVTFSLSGNDLVAIKRSILPNPANELKNLYLMDNKLRNLPNDMFVGMPKLIQVSLVNNSMQHLSEETFYPLIGKGWVVYMEENDLYCCSDTNWIAKHQEKKQIIGKCEHPQILKGKAISQLTENDFTHGLC